VTELAKHAFEVGMPHMVTDQLSEVELLKLVGDFQWRQIAASLDCSTKDLKNSAGDRLYASFINIELDFGAGAGSDLSRFEEGDHVEVLGASRFYGRQFVEGWSVLDRAPLDEGAVQAVRSRADLDGVGRPWIYMTNAFVGRVSGNLRLKTYAPDGVDGAEVQTTDDKPAGITAHEAALQQGLQLPAGARPLPCTEDGPVVYQVLPESDLNGAGLLYFARYVAMMNYAERVQGLDRMAPPLSSQLTKHLATRRRSLYYFANAPANERVRVFCTPAFVPADGAGADPLCTDFGSVVYRHELYRDSDGALMAMSLVEKALRVPNRLKGALAEARRLLARLGC